MIGGAIDVAVRGSRRNRQGRGGSLRGSGNELVDLLVAYAKQETIGPLKGLARYVAFGLTGSVAIAAGLVILLVALVRLLQTETGSVFGGSLSWLPYLIAALVALAVLATAAWRVVASDPKDRKDRKNPDVGR
jgi:hypothetical protein